MTWNSKKRLADLDPKDVPCDAGIFEFYSTRGGPVRYVGRSIALYTEIIRRMRELEDKGTRLAYVRWQCKADEDYASIAERKRYIHLKNLKTPQADLNSIAPSLTEGALEILKKMRKKRR